MFLYSQLLWLLAVTQHNNGQTENKCNKGLMLKEMRKKKVKNNISKMMNLLQATPSRSLIFPLHPIWSLYFLPLWKWAAVPAICSTCLSTSLLILSLSEFPAGRKSFSCAAARWLCAKGCERGKGTELHCLPCLFSEAAKLTRSRQQERRGKPASVWDGGKKSRRAEFSHTAVWILRQLGWTVSRYITHTLRACAHVCVCARALA